MQFTTPEMSILQKQRRSFRFPKGPIAGTTNTAQPAADASIDTDTDKQVLFKPPRRPFYVQSPSFEVKHMTTFVGRMKYTNLSPSMRQIYQRV